MNSRIWASLDDFLPPSATGPRLGRNMANHYFLSALFQYGTFDEYHFFLFNAAHRQLFWDTQGPMLDALKVREKVKVFDRIDLPEQLSNHDYTVFHQSDHINYFSAVCRLRDRFGARVPVTAFIHSVSYQEYMPRYLEMCAAGPGPSDALICSSKCGRIVLEKVFARLSDVFPGIEARMQMPVVPLGIDEPACLPDRGEARGRLGIAADEPVALSFGRFSELDKMDLFPLMQAFAEVVKTGVRCTLSVAGSVHSPNYIKMLELWIDALKLQGRVRIIKDPDDGVRSDLFAAADFFVSVSDNPQETFGLTVLEALHAGLPVAVSDFNGYRETVTDDVGFRIPTKWHPMPDLDMLQPLMDERTFHLVAAQSICVDVGYTAAVLHLLFTDKSLRRRMSAAAKMRFAACYAHRGIIAKLEATWASLKESVVPGEPQSTDSMSLCTFETFSHYTTQALSDDAQLQTTPLGLDILSKRGTYPMLPNMSAFIDNRIVVAVMERARDGRILRELFTDLSVTPHRLRYTVLWMLKHDLLAETTDAGGA